MPPAMDGQAEVADTNPESPVNTYRQAARLNRDPFSKSSREKQKVLLAVASTTIIIKLSLIKLESVSTVDFKLKFAESSADSIGIVLACVTAFYLLAFAFSAARDFANDRFRLKAASTELFRPLIAAFDVKRFIRTQNMVDAESSRLLNLSFAESSVRDNINEEFINRRTDLICALDAEKRRGADIIRTSLERKHCSLGVPGDLGNMLLSFKSDDEFLAEDVQLNDDENEQLSKVRKEITSIEAQIKELERLRDEAMEVSSARENELRDRAFNVLFDWGRRASDSSQETIDMANAVRSIRNYRKATKWIEAIFPCLLGSIAVFLELMLLWHPELRNLYLGHSFK